jgi:hypothetical protein
MNFASSESSSDTAYIRTCQAVYLLVFPIFQVVMKRKEVRAGGSLGESLLAS